MTYFATYGIYSNNGCCISHTEDYDFEATTEEEAIEEAIEKEKELEDFYSFVMLDYLENEEGKEIKIERKGDF